MSRYGEPTDEHMREAILRPLSRERLALLERAERLDGKASDAYFSEGNRIDAAMRAANHRRLAAHYQQAIDLLTAAPMPPVETGGTALHVGKNCHACGASMALSDEERAEAERWIGERRADATCRKEES